MSTGDLTPEREEQLICQLLRDKGGIDPDVAAPVIDLAAIGLVNSAWRNTCVEDWHAGGRMRDGEMLRINSYTTWRVRQLMRRWANETGLAAGSPLSSLDDIEAEDVWQLAVRLYLWLANPRRKLPTGVTLAQLAAGGLPEYEEDADEALSLFAEQAEDRGTRFGMARAAAHGALTCSRWWGHPRWPSLVDRFMSAIDNPADAHWGTGGKFRTGLPAEPPDAADRKRLRLLLLSRPWELNTDTAQWLIRAGIGYTQA